MGSTPSLSLLKKLGLLRMLKYPVEQDTYLGDVISSDGKNRKNVENRISTGIRIITQILNLLEIVSFGKHYIETDPLLRESMFINGVLFNAEVWYGFTRSEISEFEDLDRLLLRNYGILLLRTENNPNK